ncbi:MAG: hypothetical protein MRK02_11300 [Candidatus Scalindua sp.]|nr:hypothetical protein [Candidatus Scalindua sp.]
MKNPACALHNKKEVFSPIFCISLNKLDDFLQDSIYFRDVKARTRSPSLRFGESENGEEKIYAFDKFSMHHDYVINDSLGKRFVEITNDNNEIHSTGNVVPGAMTVSKIILPLEILIPELEISNINVKFTNRSLYGEKTRNIFSFQFTSNEYIQIEVNTIQLQKTVARALITGKINTDKSLDIKVKEEDVNETNLNVLREYFDTLAIESEAYLQKDDYRDYTYPLSYISALPSAEIVKQMEGEGGMINVLRMNFGNVERIPIIDAKGPEVKLARARERTTFNKIITEIITNLVTYYHGLAIVNPVAEFRGNTIL